MKRLLWSDDEGPGRFLYAAHLLQTDGWDITWAASVEVAAEALRNQPFDAVVLDQMLPLAADGDRASVWGGCTLLRWLKGRPPAPTAPPNVVPPAGDPHADNRDAPMVILSAYRHDDVEAATREAFGGEPVPLLPKPLDVEALRNFLNHKVTPVAGT
jgi:CheY-like chemotaxis protein